MEPTQQHVTLTEGTAHLCPRVSVAAGDPKGCELEPAEGGLACLCLPALSLHVAPRACHCTAALGNLVTRSQSKSPSSVETISLRPHCPAWTFRGLRFPNPCASPRSAGLLPPFLRTLATAPWAGNSVGAEGDKGGGPRHRVDSGEGRGQERPWPWQARWGGAVASAGHLDGTSVYEEASTPHFNVVLSSLTMQTVLGNCCSQEGGWTKV